MSEPRIDWPTLANVIREVDGNHDLGAGELAERILAHPAMRAARQPTVDVEEDPLRAALIDAIDLALRYSSDNVSRKNYLIGAIGTVFKDAALAAQETPDE